MDLVLQWLLLTAAVAAGWVLGRFGRPGNRQNKALVSEESVRERLQFLFTNYSDQAVENFVESLAVNSETVSLHLSIGAHFRLKGETDRAIVIHQNLLARPELPSRFSPQVTYELAFDYLTAGLLDRAETLFHEVLGDRDYGTRAAEQLIDLYQQEREWAKATQVAQTYILNRESPQIRKQLAYLTCEQADEALAVDDRWRAQNLAREALSHDSRCVRATFQQGALEELQGNLRDAIVVYLRVFDQNPAFGPDAIDSVMAIVRANEGEGVGKLLKQLRKLYAAHPSARLLLAVVECTESSIGRSAAMDLLREELEVRPSLKGLLRLVELVDIEDGLMTEEGRLVSRIGHLLIANRPVYRCVNCGFGGQQLHWLCPSCKQWETVQPIQGIAAE